MHTVNNINVQTPNFFQTVILIQYPHILHQNSNVSNKINNDIDFCRLVINVMAIFDKVNID